MPNKKKCPRCGEMKTLDEFHKNKARPDGRAGHCRSCHNLITAAYNLRRRLELMDLLGGRVCVRCGFDDVRALVIDHRDGGGSQHRKDAVSPWGVLAHGFKYPEQYQVLCWNCNHIKRHKNGEWGSVEYIARVRANPRETVTRPVRWARDYDACAKCGTTEVRHQGNGLCRNCYMQDYRS